jgi:hydroxypyruvate reductase
LFISDVPGNDPAVIGSGLMGAAPGGDQVQRTIIASADEAVAAVAAEAQRRGLIVHAGAERFEGSATRLAARFAHELRLLPAEVFVWGGESSNPVTLVPDTTLLRSCLESALAVADERSLAAGARAGRPQPAPGA